MKYHKNDKQKESRYVKKEELKKQILELTREYYREAHTVQPAFEAGKSRINYGGRYFDDKEMVNLV